MDLSKASIHDLEYLNIVKHNGLNNASLLLDAGYISSEYQLGLFNQARTDLKVPHRENQNDFKLYPFIFRKLRKRIDR